VCILSDSGISGCRTGSGGYIAETSEEGIETDSLENEKAGVEPAFFCYHYKWKSVILYIKETL
ncbi:hypothetical protein KD27_05365, partial [Smithella sp. D17]